MIHLRCSDLPLLVLCPSSKTPVANPLTRSDDGPARLGTGIHSALAWHVETGDIPDDFEAFMKPNGLTDTDEFERLFHYGVKAWRAVKEMFDKGKSVEERREVDFGTFVLSGHADIATLPSADPSVGLDWKSGWKDYDCIWQMNGYGILWTFSEAIVAWLRDQSFEVVDLVSEEEFMETVGAAVADIGLVHSAGSHCDKLYCPRQHECAAYQDYAQLAIRTMLPQGTHAGPVADALSIARAYPYLRDAEQAIARYKALLNAFLDKGVDLLLENGNKVVRDAMRIKVFDAKQALAVMTEYGVEEPEKCFKVATKMLQQEIKASAEAGETKGARWMRFLDDCETAGALRYTSRKTRREVRGGK